MNRRKFIKSLGAVLAVPLLPLSLFKVEIPSNYDWMSKDCPPIPDFPAHMLSDTQWYLSSGQEIKFTRCTNYDEWRGLGRGAFGHKGT